MISPEDSEREGRKDGQSCTRCCSAGGSDHNCYQLALVWLSVYRGVGALLPTKTHTSLDVTGTSVGTRRRQPARWYNSGQLWYLQEVAQSWKSFFQLGSPLSAAYCKQTHPRVRAEWGSGQDSLENLRVLPVFKRSAKPNKWFECLPKRKKTSLCRKNPKNVTQTKPLSSPNNKNVSLFNPDGLSVIVYIITPLMDS